MTNFLETFNEKDIKYICQEYNETFEKLFMGAYYSPSAQNMQDVEFVVLDKKLDEIKEPDFNELTES